MRLLLMLLLLIPVNLWAGDIPVNAKTYLPVLQSVQADNWPDHPFPATQAAQVEKESCVSLTSKRCWSPFAELKTNREYGFGFGQTTISYKADGTERFNTWRELRDRYKGPLNDWTWENRFDPRMQLTAMVLYDRQLYKTFATSTDDPMQQLMFSYAAYNGGAAGTLKEIRMCQATSGCNPRRWETKGGILGVEATSNKSRTAWQGYGDSAFTINRKYVKAILYERVGRYVPYYE